MSDPIYLIPCPFCGGEAVLIKNPEGFDTHCVKCSTCGCNTGAYLGGDSLQNAVDAWNRRANDDISFWEELQYMLRDATNAQAEEAIKILQEKLARKKSNG